MTKWLFALALLALSACQPNDTRVKTAKQLMDEGEVLEFSEPGFRHKGCKADRPDFSLRVTDETERARVVVGKQGSTLSPGVYNCYRVGSKVGIESFNSKLRKTVRLPGEVIVSKISWARIDKVSKSRMKGRYFNSSEQFNEYLSGVKRVLEIMGQNYVTIVEFTYINGSAIDEKVLVEQENKNNEGDGFIETTADGQCLGRCPTKLWVDTEIPTEFQPSILNKSLGSWVQLREDTGFQQGAEILLKTNRKDLESFAKARIKKVKRFRYRALDPKFFNLENFDFNKLRTFVQSENARLNSEWVTVVDLEILPSSSMQKASLSGCSSTLHTDKSLSQQSEVRVPTDKSDCRQVGSILNVVSVRSDDTVLEIPVRIKARMDSSESTTTTLILERLDSANQELP